MTIRVSHLTDEARCSTWERTFDEHARYHRLGGGGDDVGMPPAEQLRLLEQEGTAK